MSKIKLYRGFSLIELLVAVAIIGILATVVTVNGLRAKVRSRINASKIDVSSMLVTYEGYKASHLSLSSSVVNKNLINSGANWVDGSLGTIDTSFWTTVAGNKKYNPPTGSGISYRAITNNLGKAVFCAFAGDLDTLGTNNFIIGKNGDIFEGTSADCLI